MENESLYALISAVVLSVLKLVSALSKKKKKNSDGEF